MLFKQRIGHMMKYKYVPFDLGKKRFAGRRGGHAADSVLSTPTSNGHAAS